MIIPSVDIMDGNAVQLIGGKEKEIDAGDPRAKLREFRIAGEVAVIDLDAAMSQGSNAKVIEEMLSIAACRVGGGIRDVETAINWLDKGAAKIILGTRAEPEILRELPPQRVQAALDADKGEIVVEGWKEKTGRKIIDRMLELRAYVGGFLVTFVEKEGRMQGTSLDLVEELKQAAGNCSLTIAGGVTSEQDLQTLDEMGVDAQVGMAIYSGKLHLGSAIAAPMKESEFTKWPTIVCDQRGVARSFAWSDLDSLKKCTENLKAYVYQNVNDSSPIERGGILLSITPDIQRRVIQLSVHFDSTDTQWGDLSGLPKLESLLKSRLEQAPRDSYTKRLFSDADLLNGKILEEAKELVEASAQTEVRWETADLLYFAMCKLIKSELSLEDIEKELNSRSLKVSRRSGDLKN